VTAYSPGGEFNQYWYANANPYRMVDPDGRDPRRSSPNEVYLASGGDFESWDSVSAGTPPKSSPKQASTNTTGAPTDQIEQWMKSKNAKDRLRAALTAIILFKIKTHGENLAVTVNKGGRSGLSSIGQVTLYAEAFASWSWLGATLGHEFEGHYDGLGYSPIELSQSEVNAYKYSLDNVKRFGNSPAEAAKFLEAYNFHLREYELWKKSQGE
jgi:hypothetical protein